jgi:hypothetical protein
MSLSDTMSPSDLRDDGEFHNPLVHVTLGLLAFVRPLRAALVQVAAQQVDPVSSDARGVAVATPVHWALLGLVALAARVEAALPPAACVDEGEAVPRSMNPRGLLR